MRRLFAVLAAATALFIGSLAPIYAADPVETIHIGDVGFGFGKPFGTGLLAIADAKGFIADAFKICFQFGNTQVPYIR